MTDHKKCAIKQFIKVRNLALDLNVETLRVWIVKIYKDAAFDIEAFSKEDGDEIFLIDEEELKEVEYSNKKNLFEYLMQKIKGITK